MNRYLAEGLGTFFLLATVIGSGIMGETLADGNAALALLGNTIATGAILYVLITIFGPVSGAHFNPAVTLVFFLRHEITVKDALIFVFVQVLCGTAGVFMAHAMFDLPILQVSEKLRQGPSQALSEVIATFGLLMVILGGVTHRPSAVPALVGFYITAAYWFTASTSFANPAVTIARGYSNTFAGISPSGIAVFLVAQILGALLAYSCAKLIFTTKNNS